MTPSLITFIVAIAITFIISIIVAIKATPKNATISAVTVAAIGIFISFALTFLVEKFFA